jgi:hypothetical protein
MTTFKGIRGTTIEVLSSDPSAPEEGQIWYNSSSGTLKGYMNYSVNAWASGGNLNTSRTYPGGTGTQTAALIVAGSAGPGFPGFINSTEKYNGTSWTTSGNYPVNVVGNAVIGTQTAALGAGGYQQFGSYPNATNSYNGTSWTSASGTLNYTGQNMIQFGTQTAAIITAIQSNNPATQSYNGSSWTTLPATTNVSHQDGGIGFGNQTAAIIAFGGSPLTSQSESWNGSTWTTGPSVNTARQELGGSQNGTQTSGVAFGGKNPSPTGTTEIWNGTSWTTSGTLATPRYQLRGNAGSSGNSALAAGGNLYPGPQLTNATELWTGKQIQTRTLTVS